MSNVPKKIIPKIKKKLYGFLSDEDGKITKEDVLKMGMVAMGVGGMIGWTNPVEAWHTNHSNCTVGSQTSSHANWWNASGTPTTINSTATVYRWCTNVTDSMNGTVYVNSAIAPYSVVVNGHANSVASIQGGGFNGMNATINQGQSSHSNVNSHANSGSGSGSGGWC